MRDYLYNEIDIWWAVTTAGQYTGIFVMEQHWFLFLYFLIHCVSFTTVSAIFPHSQYLHVYYFSSPMFHYSHIRLHLGFPAMLKIWQVPACKMEPQRGIIIWRNLFPPAPAAARTHPPAAKLFLSMLCGVPTQILAPIKMEPQGTTRSTTLNGFKIDNFRCINSFKCVKQTLNNQLTILKMGWLSKFISLRSIPF